MNNIVDGLINFNYWIAAKFIVLFGLGVYVVFAFVVVRQVKIMTEVVSGILTGFLRFISWTFFLFSVAIWFLVFVFL